MSLGAFRQPGSTWNKNYKRKILLSWNWQRILSIMSEVMSSHLPGRKDASWRASQRGLMGTTLSLVHSAHPERCTEATESQFSDYALVNTLLFKKKNGKLGRQANPGHSPIQPLQKVKGFISAITRHFMLKGRKTGHRNHFWWALELEIKKLITRIYSTKQFESTQTNKMEHALYRLLLGGIL